MAVVDFLAGTMVSAFDPLLIVAYGLAAFFARSAREAAMWGIFAGIVVAGLFMLLPSATGLPPPPLLTFQWILACGLGAGVVRAAINRFRASRPSAGAP